MLMAVDVGNTNMVFGLLEGEKVLGSFRLATDHSRTADELGLLACQYFHRFGLDPQAVTESIIVSVVPQVMPSLTRGLTRYFGKAPLVVDVDVFPKLAYEGSERLGPDRSVACVAAMEKYGAPVIMLDFGTATTLDAVNEQGVYLGGCILAGVRTSVDALFRQAAMLPQIDLRMPETVLGMTTVSQIQAGSVMGYVGAAEYLIRRAKQETGFGDRAKVVATGGLAQLIADNTDLIHVVDHDLIMDGLCILARQHRESQKA